MDGVLVQVSQTEREHADLLGTMVDVRRDGELVGSTVLDDALRPDAAATVTRLPAITSRPVQLLTGDDERTAADIASGAGIRAVHARLLPADKASTVQGFETDGVPLLLAGGRVNDAPALAAASIGVALGRYGSDLALDTADAVIIRDELSAIPAVIEPSRKAHRFVVTNLVIAAAPWPSPATRDPP